MTTKTMASAVLITLGLVVLACSGLSFTTPGSPIEFLGLHIETTDRHFISPAIGAIALACGVALLLIKSRRV